jgi:hypothetical protein
MSQTDTRNLRIRCGLQMDILNGAVNYILEKVIAEQLHLLSAVQGFPHAIKLPGLESESGIKQEEFAILKQLVNALLSVRLYTRGTVATRAIRLSAAKVTPGSHLLTGGLNSFGGTEDDAGTASVAAKRKFKSKRRKSVESSSGSLFSGYGSDLAAGGDHAELFLNSSKHVPTPDPPAMKPASNLAKLAALLGKSSKGS